MSELTQSLQIAVTRYPGTMAELARRTAIDRSTLYKIINGQRTPPGRSSLSVWPRPLS